jgi:transketolase
MASEGYHVFTYSIANFPTFRCAEQIRNDVAYHKLAVTVVCVGGGLAYGALGYSHHAVQDYALMRTLPNMLIAAPGDPMEVISCLRYLVAHPGPSYLRLGKAGEPNFHYAPPEVSPGRWLQVHKGNENLVLLSTGACLQIAMDWTKTREHADRSVYSMPLWSMADKAAQADRLLAHEDVLTIEDHLQDGGFGSWLLEARAIAGTSGTVRPVALSAGVCGTVGSQAILNRFGGLAPV